MAKKAAATMLDLHINFSGHEPLHRQLYTVVKQAILGGHLRPGASLPSTRLLARDLRVSRTTVLSAFDQLTAEGYLEGKMGSGTRVSAYVPGDLRRQALRTRGRTSHATATISRRSRLPPTTDLSFFRTAARPLRPGQPDVSLFPLDLWSRLAAKHWRRANRDPEHSDSLGYRPLRQAICDYVLRLRSVRCDPDQVLIVCGAQQALYLCAHTLLDPGEPAWMEDPGYPRARAAFLGAQLTVIPVPVDAEGLVVSAGRKLEPSPKLIFVTPSFQCPLGSMMSLARRFELLEVARASGAWILEDDYFCEYRYGGDPVASLRSIDQDDRVIYIGNFSKSVVPSLRIGYLILPPALVETFQRARSAMSRQPPGVEQAILAEFIREGHLERFVRTTLRTYHERRGALVDAIDAHAKGMLETSPDGTGMYLAAWLNPGVSDRSVAKAAAMRGIDAIPLSTFCARPLRRKGLVLGYSSYDVSRIRLAVKQLAAVLATHRRLVEPVED
jgi:GntR family transcriptional regulator / MocR family aminotransferase